MVLLERSLADENVVRMALVQQKNALCCNVLEQDHHNTLSKRATLHEMEMKLREDQLKKRNAVHDMEMKLLSIKEKIVLRVEEKVGAISLHAPDYAKLYTR
ncbi:hypothetical protein HPB47_005857 [Ixodes persulcatus]|uniref:Uncharacterized protein n=1 Tax=Ixodes persulcatus TaxID=34615 RepID=A0AC60PBU2_IXOPE|nr:hypothetical protein HPB47_005857 [Ixodes persulcatus]